MDPNATIMSRGSERTIGNRLRLKYWGWKHPLKWWRAHLLLFRGWKCEGPFPKANHDALLILGPGFEGNASFTSMVEHRLKFRGNWLPQGLTKRESLSFSNHDLILIGHQSAHLPDALAQASSLGISVQLIRVAFSDRRIRCNTPFTPGKFPERDLTYIYRMFTYND